MASITAQFLNTIILNNLYNYRKSGNFCDVKLTLGKKHINAHAALLCSVSSYIYRSYKRYKELNKMKARKKTMVKVKISNSLIDCFECFEKLMDLIYGQKMSVDTEHYPHIKTYCEVLDFTKEINNLVQETLKNGYQHEKYIKREENKDAVGLSQDSKIILEVNELKIKSELKYTKDDAKLQNDHFNLECCKSFEENDNSNLEHSTSHEDIDNSNLEDCFTSQEIFEKQDDQCNTKKDKLLHSGVAVTKIKRKKIQCLGCDFTTIKPKKMSLHFKETNHGKNTCAICFMVFKNNEDLKSHLNYHVDFNIFACSHCNKHFESKHLLKQHLLKHKIEKSFICNICHKTFKRKHGLKCHLVTHTAEKKHLCDECGFSSSHSRILKAHKLIHSGEFFKCSVFGCSHTSTRKENMKRHIETHKNEKPFICELCGQKFTQSKSLRRHALIHGKGERMNMCSYCPFKALRVDNLKAHILRQHTDKPPKGDVVLPFNTIGKPQLLPS